MKQLKAGQETLGVQFWTSCTTRGSTVHDLNAVGLRDFSNFNSTDHQTPAIDQHCHKTVRSHRTWPPQSKTVRRTKRPHVSASHGWKFMSYDSHTRCLIG